MMDNDQTSDDIEEVDPWLDIWVRPRQTIEWIVDNYSSAVITISLIYLGGVYFGIGQAELKDYGDRMELSGILLRAIFVSGLGGLLTYHIWIWAIDFCASWFGGKGNFKATQVAFAWAMLPMATGLLLTLIGYVLFKDELFTSETENISGSTFLTIAAWTYGILEATLGIWHLVLLVATISQVHRLTILKSIASIVTSILFLMLPLIGLVLLARN